MANNKAVDLKKGDLFRVKSGKVYKVHELPMTPDDDTVGAYQQRNGKDYGPYRLIKISSIVRD